MNSKKDIRRATALIRRQRDVEHYFNKDKVARELWEDCQMKRVGCETFDKFCAVKLKIAEKQVAILKERVSHFVTN